MKLLIINFEYPPLGGGGGVATRDLAMYLAADHEVHVLTTRYKSLPAYENEKGIHVHRVGVIGRTSLPTASLISMITFVPSALLVGWKLCRKTTFDVVNAQFVIPSGIPALVLARLFRLPFVLSFIGGDLYEPSKGLSPHRYALLRWLVRFIAARATLCTAISVDTRRHAQEMHGVKKEVVITPLGLTPAQVPMASKEELGFDPAKKLFVSVGRLIPRKDYQTLLAGWREVAGAQLAIIGSGPLEGELKELIVRYGLSDRVTLLGFVPEEKKQQVLRAADAYISTAIHEGFGIVFLEAMDAGLPIIATDDGGQTDFLSQGENAILIPPHEPKQVASAVAWLCRDTTLTSRLSQNNKKRVQDFYLDKTTKQFETVLQHAMQAYAHRD